MPPQRPLKRKRRADPRVLRLFWYWMGYKYVQPSDQ